MLPVVPTSATYIYVIDLNGHVDRTYQYAPGSYELDVDMSSLPTGLYSVRIIEPQQMDYNLKVVKQ